MSKQSFIPSVNEDLNRPHNVTLTEGQISTILYIVEGYLQGNDDGYDPEFRQDIDNIFEETHYVIKSYVKQVFIILFPITQDEDTFEDMINGDMS